MTFLFHKILLGKEWANNVAISINDQGRITSIEQDSTFSEHMKTIDGFTLPGFQNAHSHSFQYAMAGLAEIHQIADTSDDFWSWRDSMYQLALTLNPDEFEAIATMLYAEMLKNGYTNVAEFHYLHHDKNGKPYTDISEMGKRLISAANTTGINITLVPIFYQKGGFGKEPTDGQRRFLSPTTDDYLKLLESSRDSCKLYRGATIGLGFHSMRGVSPQDIINCSEIGPKNIPYHIHISEQLKEIEDCQNHLKKRPVEWLLDNVNVNQDWHLVHATHLTLTETVNLAKSGSSVVLCPSTEGNLGDGLFPLKKYQHEGGRWSIGTDSHIGLNPFEELRLLDYGQRLVSHQRNIFNSTEEGNSGDYAIKMALINGRRAMGNMEEDYFKVGEPLNATVVDSNTPFGKNTADKALLSTLVYTHDKSNIQTTISNGKIVIQDGRHVHYDIILDQFNSVLNRIKTRH